MENGLQRPLGGAFLFPTSTPQPHSPPSLSGERTCPLANKQTRTKEKKYKGKNDLIRMWVMGSEQDPKKSKEHI